MVSKTERSTNTTVTYSAKGMRSISSTSSDDTVEYWSVPSLVKGQWVEYPSGFRFRLPTNYGKAHIKLSRGSSYYIKEERYVLGKLYQTIVRESSPGGYKFGNFFSGNFIYRLDGEVGIPNVLGPPRLVTDERNEAVTKSLNDIADQKVNIGENLATLGQTARLFINPMRSFVNLAKSYHRLPVGRELPWGKLARMTYRDLVRGKYGSKIAEKYLEYVYGFKPLMQDIYEISELAKSQAKHPLLINGRGSASRSGSASDKYYNNISTGQDEYWEDISYVSKTRATLWAKLKDEYALTRTLNQLGLLNPASLAWELVPLSFVIDWALPIGPVLQAMTAPAGLDFVGGSVSRRVSAAWSYRIDKQASYNITLESRPADGAFAYNGYVRERINNWPRAGLWFAPDPLGLHRDGSDRSIKGLALAIARLPRSL